MSELLGYIPRGGEVSGGLMKSMVDSNYQVARISIQMADVGSVELKTLNQRVQTIVDEVFPKDKYDVKLTGTPLIFLKGNDYLVANLLQSVIAALIIISIMMAFLFFSCVCRLSLDNVDCNIILFNYNIYLNL
jgi:predicted RND superfamily exporter protein